MTKHEQIIKYIESLSVGHKISVRQIAKDLNVSEGTAYRAIKEADNQGLVASIDRVGTVRIERKSREQIENLTFNEIVKIVDGQVLGGKQGLYKTLSKFAIGAMELNDVVKYLTKNTLLIVGNRSDVQMEALKRGSAVLITGGFEANEDIINYADEHELPIILSNYDTFLVANIINRAIYDQMIKKEILMVEDIMIPLESTSYLDDKQKVRDWNELSQQTSHTRFPVVDSEMKVVGILTSKDIVNEEQDKSIRTLMTKSPIIAHLNTTIATCAHLMIWEGIELLPVVSTSKVLIGIISREDVLKTMQLMSRQPQIGETIHDQIAKQITMDNGNVVVNISPQLTNQFGMLTKSVYIAVIEEALRYEIRKMKKSEIMIEHIDIYYLKTVQIDDDVEVKITTLDIGRIFAKFEVTMVSGSATVAKALLMCQILEK
ncbi:MULTISPECIES: DRTGG domain-containing protein [Mammaliicoccus]|uniref:DRTGG domain-containing protein n=1 Tax=Mammaliicoccus TaxID=2803850 RepID=UPI00065B9FC0|nr:MULTISPECIES: DRTGG domain-containing protein [Mammaliicoccus]MBO1218867.1 CBS domain-containing protein [Mammaliicoccus sciuri]MBO1232414.1 CBS domain-containing protein [Mammaliicoccus sciuri]MDQ7129681.1 DRTGG domain-containing protein [Mammaliicoccus sciuri]PNY91692.1 CBS domain-containing protein [Mammaliicoccus sciuri]PTJ79854.1 CBS domain-containing protein [Mammaliicoccus sciuri]